MDRCEHYIDLLSQSLDGPLSLEEQQALQLHLDQCPECRLLSQQFLEIREEFHSWEEQEVPDGFTAGVMDRIRAAEEKPNVIPIWKHRQFKTLGSIAACAVICLGLWRTGAPTNAGQETAVAPAASAPAAGTMDIDFYALADSATGDGAAAPASVAKTSDPPPAQDASASLSVPLESALLPDTDQLIRLAQDTLGQLPGTLLLVDELPELEEGTVHTAADGTKLLVLSAQPEGDVWKDLTETACFCLELGDGPIVFMTTT